MSKRAYEPLATSPTGQQARAKPTEAKLAAVSKAPTAQGITEGAAPAAAKTAAVTADSSVSIDTTLRSQGSAIDNTGTPISKKPKSDAPAQKSFNLLLYGAAVKDNYKQQFEDAVGDSWPHSGKVVGKSTVLVGTEVEDCKQVVVLVPDKLVPSVIAVLGRISPMTYVRIKDPRPGLPLEHFSSYDSFVLTTPPTPARFTSENFILDTAFNGGPLNVTQATLLEGKNKTFTIAGYLTEPIVYYKGNGPANAKVLVNGDGNQEITIKIWSDVYKQLAANLLKVGPVSFDVTVKKGTYQGVTTLQYHCNSPHFGTPLGGDIGADISIKAQQRLTKEATVIITAYDIVTPPKIADDADSAYVPLDEVGPPGVVHVTAVLVKLVWVDGSDKTTAIIRDSRIAGDIFGSTCGPEATDMFEWLGDVPWRIDMLSAYDITGKIQKGKIDSETGCMIIDGFSGV